MPLARCILVVFVQLSLLSASTTEFFHTRLDLLSGAASASGRTIASPSYGKLGVRALRVRLSDSLNLKKLPAIFGRVPGAQPQLASRLAIQRDLSSSLTLSSGPASVRAPPLTNPAI